MLNSSSSRIALAAFTRSPFTLTLPPATAAAASERVLKNLAAQSHLSRRIGLPSVSATTIPDFSIFPILLQKHQAQAQSSIHCCHSLLSPRRKTDGAFFLGLRRGHELTDG